MAKKESITSPVNKRVMELFHALVKAGVPKEAAAEAAAEVYEGAGK